jgi:hypothetical protein
VVPAFIELARPGRGGPAERPSLSNHDKENHMRTVRCLRGTVAGFAIAIGLAVTLPAGAASAAPVPAGRLPARTVLAGRQGQVRPLYDYGPWTVENSPGTYDSSPSPSHSNGVGVSNGTRLTLECYFWGAPAGPYSDPLWYEVGYGDWINDHYLNTPGTAANPQPQTPECWPGAGPPPTGSSVGWSVTFGAENSPGTWATSPSAARGVSGIGIGNGDTIGLNCYLFGNPDGPYGNTLWYVAEDLSNNTYGWINDHYLSTPGTAANPEPQTGRCPGF